VTTFEGYPIKHYVFEGNRKDETTVKQVVKELKSAYNIEDTTGCTPDITSSIRKNAA